MRPRSLLLVVLAVLATRAGAQESPDQQARRLLEDGRSYLAQGKGKQALENFNIVVSSFPNTDSVGSALLEMGRYYMEVERDADKARGAFEQVTKQHARDEAAPGAYYFQGMLTLNRATTAPQIEDALAQFKRVETLYPASPWVPRAIAAQALAHRHAGRYAEASDLNRRVALEYPASDAAAGAQYEIGRALALAGQPRLAMEEFQQVRNRFPKSAWAEPALQRTTALYRLFGSAKPAFALDPAFSAGVGDVMKDVRALLVAPSGTLWVASEKTKSALALEGGKPGAGFSAEDPRTLSLSPAGELVTASKTAVRVGLKDIRSFTTPAEKPGAPPKPVEKILAAGIAPGGAVLVSDEEREAILKFDAKGEYQGTFPGGRDAAKRKVSRILLDGEGGIVTLDREDKTIRVWDDGGRLLRSVGPAGLKRPVDVAVDAFRNLYVADEETGVHVFNPQGQLLATIASPELRKARALTLDATGAVLVYDDRAERVLRYR